MRVQHFCELLSVTRNHDWNKNKLSKSLEKLSSGLRINRSADDAAGLAISERMRAQIAGLNQAERNSKDGELLIQVGEGALTEIHALLQRANVLAEQSANGIYDDETARAALQKELDEICEEIDRIAEYTSYCGINLFRSRNVAANSDADSVTTYTQDVSAKESALLWKELSDGTKSDEVTIVYTETERTYDVSTTQTPQGSGLTGDKTFSDGTKLSDLLKKSIVPQTVQNILESYPAFSYLKGSAIGIGLEYFDDASSSTLAYVKGRAGSSGTMTSNGTVTSRTDYIVYTLGVNTARLGDILNDSNARSELEATIAHEMIHAFMDEAMTSGMFGLAESKKDTLTSEVTRFPEWFIEGMAQTASGPGNWLKAGLKISENSTLEGITNAIISNKLSSGTTESKYGTGYLACMYLGAVIAGKGTVPDTINANVILNGLTSLMNSVIGGKSLDAAIKELTNQKFGSLDLFVSAFDQGTAEKLGEFVHNLLTASKGGRGGLISYNLADQDLANDSELSGIRLFELNTENSEVKNIYPDKYCVYSGGASSVDGSAPTGFESGEIFTEYGDFLVSGDVSGVSYDEATGTLKVEKHNSNVKISMKASPTSAAHHILLNRLNGTVTLDQVTVDSLTIQGPQSIKYEGENTIGKIQINRYDGNNTGTFSFTGTGQLKTEEFITSIKGQIKFIDGAVIVNAVNGSINAPYSEIYIKNTLICGEVFATKVHYNDNLLSAIDISSLWQEKLSGLSDLISVSVDNNVSKLMADKNQSGSLWVREGSDHLITFTDSKGVKKTVAAKWDDIQGQFTWGDPIKPFTVTKADGSQAVEGIDYHYEDNDFTLVIDHAVELTISGGDVQNELGQNLRGRIRLADNISSTNADGTISNSVTLTLDGISCTKSTGYAFDLGSGNYVTLILADKSTNTFTARGSNAGIILGAGTDLNIVGTKIGPGVDQTQVGTLIATGGNGSAGIGRSGCSKATEQKDTTSDITITGGIIYAQGGEGGAGIGGGLMSAIGNITIDSAVVHSTSKGHGAGIGGGWTNIAVNGTITITGSSEVWASSEVHGTGIGAGCQASSGDIMIDGDTIIHQADGGDSGAGIGASWGGGSCGNITIAGNASVEDANGGDYGSGIGSGSANSKVTGTILIDTTGSVTARGGKNGVGIGSSCTNSYCSDIIILQGVVKAVGDTDGTGIGAGRDSFVKGNITIGSMDPAKAVVVSTYGGMTCDGGNILSYTDRAHKKVDTIQIIGINTTVRAGEAGEGLYNTSGVTDENGNKLYSYPLYLFKSDQPLAASTGLKVDSGLPLPDKSVVVKITVTDPDDPTKTKSWELSDNHNPLDENYVYLWMEGKNQKVTVEYKDKDGNQHSADLDLIFYENAGVFRIGTQPEPQKAQEPGYNATLDGTPITPSPDPDEPKPDPPPEEPKPTPSPGGSETKPILKEGIILQIGPSAPEILVVPRFYLSVEALNLDNLDISTQNKASDSIELAQNAIRQVSSMRGIYGSLSNRLDHNIRFLGVTGENLTAAESKIRDADMAMEATEYTANQIRLQASQAMAVQGNHNVSLILQLISQ